MSEQEVRRELLLAAPAARVWAALTEPDRLSAWFGARARMELRVGGIAIFTRPDGVVRNATVEAIEAERLLMLRWHPFERDANGRARQRPAGTLLFRVAGEGARTRLTVVETKLDDAPTFLDLYPPRYLDSHEMGPTWGPPSRAAVGA